MKPKDKRFLRARSIVQIALQFVIFHTHWIAVTWFTSKELIKTEWIWFTFVAFATGHMRWTDTFSSVLFTQWSRWTVTWFTIRKSVIACSACVTLSPNDVRFALTLTTKWITFEWCWTFIITVAGQSASVVVSRQWEHRLFTKIGCIQLNMEMILTALLNEFFCLINSFFFQEIIVKLTFRDNQHIVEPYTFLMWILWKI